MSARPDFIDTQYALAAAVRDPTTRGPAEIEPRRLAIYQELIYNNLDEFLGNAFPVLRQISDDAQWHGRVRGFLRDYRCHTPLFNQIAQEFVNYLTTTYDDSDDYPFLTELAHYEWSELALTLATDEFIGDEQVDIDLLEAAPHASPLTWLSHYVYPVHRIAPDYLPGEDERGDYYIAIYRDRHDKVGFLELNPVSARLLQLVQANGEQTGLALLRQIGEELGNADMTAVYEHGIELLTAWRKRDMIRAD